MPNPEKDPYLYRIDPDVSLGLSSGLERSFNQWEEWQLARVYMKHDILPNLVPNALQYLSEWTYSLVCSTAFAIILTAAVNKPEKLKSNLITTILPVMAPAGFRAGIKREELDKDLKTMIQSFNIPSKVTRIDN
jgi:hypothetical protein